MSTATSRTDNAARKTLRGAANRPALVSDAEHADLRFLIVYPAAAGLAPYLRTPAVTAEYINACERAGEEPFSEDGDHAMVYLVRPGGTPTPVDFYSVTGGYDDDDYAHVRVAVLGVEGVDEHGVCYTHLTDLHYRVDGRS